MFQVSPLPVSRFAHLFGRTDDELAALGVVPRTAVDGSRMPCRLSLRDALPGERTLLLNFTHLDVDTPYRSSYAIYVIDGAAEAHPAPGELPPVFQGRPLAVRAFSQDGMLLDAGLAMGEAVREPVVRLLDRPEVAWLHVHNAMHGCYAARIDRI